MDRAPHANSLTSRILGKMTPSEFPTRRTVSFIFSAPAARSVFGKLEVPMSRSSFGALRMFPLLIVPMLFFSPYLLAGAAADPVAAAAAVRKADAAWAAAAGAARVGVWMSFYADDALVLLPNEELASGKELVRQTVSRLLAQPHLSIALRPIETSVAQSGDLVFVVEGYELRFGGPRVPPSDRGRRLEIWRKQADGSWKCIVDSWKLDAVIESAAPIASPSASAATSAEPPPPVSAPESGPPAPARGTAAKYGEVPTNYEETIRKYFLEHLKHPESVQYRQVTAPEQGYTTEVTGGLLMRETREYGWLVKATIDAKDSRDSFVGFKTYTFLFRGEKIVDARLPLPGDEMN
jgi:ketosteroid isomerase-like protein